MTMSEVSPSETSGSTTVYVFDAHHHVGEVTDLFAGMGEAVATADLEVAKRLEGLDHDGVRHALVIAGHGYLRPDGLADTRRVNDGIARYRDSHPERFPAAVGIVEPTYGNRGLEEIDRCAEELRLVGISFHHRFQGQALNSPWTVRYVERIAERGLVAFIHCYHESSEEALWKLEDVAQKVPQANIVALDVFSGWEQMLQTFSVAPRVPNVCFETALCAHVPTLVRFVREFGAERVIYGSDTYSWPLSHGPNTVLLQLRTSDLSTEEKRLVLGANLASLVGPKR